MTAVTTMYMNMPNQPTMFGTGGECTTPEIINNLLMDNDTNPFMFNQSQPPFSNYYLPEHMEAPVSYIASPAAPCTGLESLPVYCGPQVASSPPMPTSSSSPAGTTNEPQHHLYHQLVKTELKFHICRRQAQGGSPTLPAEAAYTTADEVNDWANPTITNLNTNININTTNTTATNNIINNNLIITTNNNCTATENSFNYKPCLQSLGSPDDQCFYYSSEHTLTPEDEHRRKKRRERNKIAATKCRNKKKEKTAILMKESEELHHTNASLKNEITKLQEELKKLTHVLSNHSCKMRHNNQHMNSHQNHMANANNNNVLYNFDMYNTAGSGL